MLLTVYGQGKTWHLMLGLVILLLLACSQASTPGDIGQTLAAGNGAGLGSGATSLKSATIAADSSLQTRFPTMARLQLSITSATASAGLPLQFNVSPTGAPFDLKLPTSTPLTITFDVFDAAGLYLGTGSQQSTIQANANPSIPVNINTVTAGTVYVNPLTLASVGATGAAGGTGNLTSPVLSVVVQQGASQQPISNITVMLGSTGPIVLTDLNGIANFANIALPQDVHVFSGSQAVSVIQFNGSSLTVPMQENVSLSASVHVNAPNGPTLAAGELLDIYFTDGMSIQVIGGLANDQTALRATLTLPLRDPIAVTAMIEQPTNPTPKTDHGLILTSITTGHYLGSQLNISIADPATQTLVAPVGSVIIVGTTPAGLHSIQSITADVFAVLAGDVYALISHKDNNLLPANRRDISIWPVNGTQALMRHIQVSDPYGAKSEAWQRELAPLSAASFANIPVFASVPVMNTASLASMSWSDSAGAPTWDGYLLDIRQGAKTWRIYGFQNANSVLIPTPPAGQLSFTAGVTATASIQRFSFHAQSGFQLNAPDLWYLPRMLNQRASSAVLVFTP